MNISDSQLLHTLEQRFGHSNFQGPQETLVRAVLAGRDVLVTLPTGAGKSLVYQLPAVLLEGLTLVVSPLIALMKDQVDALCAKGIAAAQVNSAIAPQTRAKNIAAAIRGDLDLLFVTPERFRSPSFIEAMPHLPITRLAVDEAHCISHWGHDFRPDYHRLGLYRERLGSPPTIALTATATRAVAEDIVQSLGLKHPLVHRGGIERENLFMAATRVHLEEEKVPLLADRIASIHGPGIVYSALIRDLEHLNDELRRRGIRSLVYHGKLSTSERRQMQEAFMESDEAVVLATNAFGMGIDKPNIRFVLHAQVPRTLESWAQEIGRAGRDGKPSLCELIYFAEDIAIQQNFIQWANPSREYLVGVYEVLRGWGERLQAKDLDDLRDELLIRNRSDNRVSICLKWFEVLGVSRGAFESHDLELVREFDPAELPPFVGSEEKLRADLEGLLAMVRFATNSSECRRRLLEQHFGLERTAGNCGSCDVCSEASAWRSESFQPRGAAALKAPAGPARSEHEKKTSSAHSASAKSATQAPKGARGPRSSTSFRRGDWVRVGRSGLAQVLRVDREGSGVRLTIEDSQSLVRRTVDPSKVRIERLDG